MAMNFDEDLARVQERVAFDVGHILATPRRGWEDGRDDHLLEATSCWAHRLGSCAGQYQRQ